MGQVIAVVSGKGGTGKTSFTALVGSALAEMGHRTLCLDCDVGLRNLDLALGMSDSALMDFTDVILSRATLEQAAVRHPRCDRLYLLTAPVGLHEDIRTSEMKGLLDEVRSENPALAQAAFEEFCRRIGHSVPARTAPRRLTTVVRWTQRIAAVLIVITFFTSIFPIVSFAFETFLPNPGDYSFLYTGDADNLTVKWWTTDENITENGMYGQKGILHNETIWHAFRGTILVSVCCSLLAGTIGTMIGYAVSKNRRSRWANYVNAMAFLPYLMPSIAVGVAFFILFSNQYINLFNTYALLIIVGTIKYIPFASRSSLNSMLQLSGEIEEAAIIQDIPWIKRMTRIIIPIQKSSIISGYLLPFMTCLRELSLFMLLCVQGFILSTTLDYFDEMGLYAFSSGINLILIVTILVCNTLVNKITGASLDKGIGG